MPINKLLKTYYEDLNLPSYPNDYYLFGSFRTKKGNIAKFEDFIPAPRKIKRDTATASWKRIVKDGLKIAMNMYNNKHVGANVKIMAGMDLDVLRERYGHTSNS